MKILNRTLACIYFILITNAACLAQYTIIVDEQNKQLYDYSPFTEFVIRDDVFKEGNYLFYLDSAKKFLLFEGQIRNGKTNGKYYTYPHDNDGNWIKNNATSIISLEGKWDGAVELVSSICLDERIKIKQFTLYFDKGEIRKIKITDPFYRNILDKNTKDTTYDSLLFLFKNGELISAIYTGKNNEVEIQPRVADMVQNNISMLNLGTNEKFSIRNNINTDTTIIEFVRKYVFNDKQTSWKKELQFQYDAKEKQRRVILITAIPLSFPLNNETEYHTFTLWEAGFGSDNKIQYIYCADKNDIFAGLDGNTYLLFSNKEINFGRNGILKNN